MVQGGFSPHKFRTISRCGVNGHFAFGVMGDESRSGVLI